MASSFRNQKTVKYACQAMKELEQLLAIRGESNVDECVSDNLDGHYIEDWPAWLQAVHYDNATILKLILQKSTQQIKPTHLSKGLWIAFDNENHEILEVLLEYGNKCNIVCIDDYRLFCDEITRLNPEVKPELMTIILKYGSQIPDSAGNEGEMASKWRKYFTLCGAIFNNDLTKVDELLNCGDDLSYLEISSKCNHPARFAYNSNRSQALDLFVKKQVGLERILFLSIQRRDQNLMKQCLAEGANPIIQDESGRNAFTFAYKVRNLDAFSFLLEKYDSYRGQVSRDTERSIFKFIDDVIYLKIILDRFPEMIINLNIRGVCHNSAILLKYGADPMSCIAAINYEIVTHVQKLRLIDPQYANYFMRIYPRFHNEQKLSPEVLYNCQFELGQLKNIQISKSFMSSPRQTLFDFIFYKPGKAARYSKNEIILELYAKSGYDFEKMYTNFGYILNYQLRRGQARRNFMELASITLHLALGSEMPEELTNEVFKHFTDEELNQLGKNPEFHLI